MQMARHKLTSYILYVSKTISKTMIDSRVVQVKFNLQCKYVNKEHGKMTRRRLDIC